MRAPIAALAILFAARAAAQAFPARTGETGILDVPDAEATGVGGGQLGVEFRFDRTPGAPDNLGPLPLYAVAGMTRRLDLGLTLRESGQPGDPRPTIMLFGAAAKLQLWAPDGAIPGAALSAVFDRINDRGEAGARVAISTEKALFRIGAFGGAEAEASGFRRAGPTGGVAASVALARRLDLAAEALTGPRGRNYGAALRWYDGGTMGVSVGANYFPGEEGWRVALTLAFAPRPKAKTAPGAPMRPGEAATARETQPVAAGPRFLDERPKFRLRMALSGPEGLADAQRHQYGPYVAPSAGGAIARAVAAPPIRAAAPSIDDLADAQLRDQEALAEVRERRVRATADQLDGRLKAAQDEGRRLSERERELASREQQLDARERRIGVRGAPTQQERNLEALELVGAAQERTLSAQERSYGPAVDAAQGRERDAAAREDLERQEASRLAASVSGAHNRAEQLDLRKQALGARNRQLAALEARLVAKGELIDALERQLHGKGERLAAWQRRLDSKAERLDLIERRLAEPKAAPAAAPKPTGAKAGAPKDKPAFVMVVKSPTAIVKERPSASSDGASGAGIHPGVAVEKSVAAATVVAFPSPASQLSELDRETIDNIAKLAAKDQCELLIWARAKDPSLMGEAQRRAAEIRTRVMATGPLPEKQVVTRITSRPGSQGVDVVVSALRETANPAGPATSAPSAPPAGATLDAGEGGKRQIRDAVIAAQPSIEPCVGEHLRQQRLQRGEGTLRVTVSSRGRVTKVVTTGGDLAGDELEACLAAASASWQFPAAEAQYVVDIPITAMSGGTAR